MKKHSKNWKIFSSLDTIINVKIDKVNIRIIKREKELSNVLQRIDEKLDELTILQSQLKNLTICQEDNALSLLFQRRERIKSQIEDVYFDNETLKRQVSTIHDELASLQVSKFQLEKRKVTFNEVKRKLNN
jgi:DNA repair exonuclease SbcCD ATPase subunit